MRKVPLCARLRLQPCAKIALYARLGLQACRRIALYAPCVKK